MRPPARAETPHGVAEAKPLRPKNMTEIMMNVGLAIAGERPEDSAAAAADAAAVLARYGVLVDPARAAVVESSTEPTLVAAASLAGGVDPHAAIANAAVVLLQDAIAWRDADGTGHIDGPAADAWLPWDDAQWVALPG